MSTPVVTHVGVAGTVARSHAGSDSFWNPVSQAESDRNKGAGRGYLAVRGAATPLADAALQLVIDFHREQGRSSVVGDVVDQVWLAGCRDPQVAVDHALATAFGGREADLAATLADCRAALAARNGSTERAWGHLAVVAGMLDGQLGRLTLPAAARHFPADPKRPARTPRFLRSFSLAR